jgi:hypothetical protein
MTSTPEYFASLLVLTGAAWAVAGASLAVATPPVSGQSASDVIRELEDQGYNVGINWVNGNTNAPLSECAVSAVHNPDHSPDSPPPATFTTVYVDVVCPNNDDPGGISVGVGIG